MTPKTHLKSTVAFMAIMAVTTPAWAQSTIFNKYTNTEARNAQTSVALRYADALQIAHRILAEDLRVSRTPGLADHLASNDQLPDGYAGLDQRLTSDYGLRARYCDGSLLTYLDPEVFSAAVTPKQIQAATALHRHTRGIPDITDTNVIGYVQNGNFIGRFRKAKAISDCFANNYAEGLPHRRPALLTPVTPLDREVYTFEAKTYSHHPCPDGRVGGGVLRATTSTFGRSIHGRDTKLSDDGSEVVQSFCRLPVSGTREVVRPCTLTIASKDIPSTFTVSTPFTEVPDPNDPFATVIDFDQEGTIIRSRCSALPADAPTVSTTGVDVVNQIPLACPIEFPEGERIGEQAITTTTTRFTTGQPDIINVFTSDVTETVNDCHRLEARATNEASRHLCPAPFSGGFFDNLTTTEETFQVFADGRDDVLVADSATVVNQQTTHNACFTDETTFEDDPETFGCGSIYMTGAIGITYRQQVVTRNFADPAFADVEVSRVDVFATVTSNTCTCTFTGQELGHCIGALATQISPGTVIDGGHNPDADALGVDGHEGGLGTTGSSSSPTGTGEGGDGGDGACVIYTELTAQGRLSRADQILNWYWTQKRYADPQHMIRGYQLWAKPVVRAMQSSPRVSAIASHLAHARLREIEYQLGRRDRVSLTGKMVRLATEPLSWALGFFVPPLLGEGHKAPHGPTKEITNA